MVLPGIQRFEGLGLTCSVWWSVPTWSKCVWNSSPWQVWNATRHWTKIFENEKGGHSNMSNRNPKGCSLERQVGCVHSDKHAHSPCWRRCHQWIWPCYQTCVVENYIAYTGFVDKSDRIVNNYGIAWRSWKCTKKLFFRLTDTTVLNTFLIHKSCGGKMTHKNFREVLICELIIHSCEENLTASGISRGRPSLFAS